MDKKQVVPQFVADWSVFNRKTWRGEENAQLTESEIKQDFDWALKFAEEM